MSTTDRTITLKELYALIDVYFAEAEQEGFTPSVGDFVDFVASRDEEQEDKTALPKKIHHVGFPLIQDQRLDEIEEKINEVIDYLSRKEQ